MASAGPVVRSCALALLIVGCAAQRMERAVDDAIGAQAERMKATCVADNYGPVCEREFLAWTAEVETLRDMQAGQPAPPVIYQPVPVYQPIRQSVVVPGQHMVPVQPGILPNTYYQPGQVDGRGHGFFTVQPLP